jgi:UDP-N-acetylglucosamine 2-epimerase (non-hydrolysing)
VIGNATSRRIKVMTVLGTRPEAIKLAPVIKALRNDPSFESFILATAQHRDLLDQVLEIFGIVPDRDLNIMTSNQTLVGVVNTCLRGVDELLREVRPDMVLVQGDTATVFATALACYYNRVAVGHVEAGLRTDDKYSPFPEEGNRRLATVLADLHFAPTEWAKRNLLREGNPEERVPVTGNTVVDALLEIASRPPPSRGMPKDVDAFASRFGRMILVTAHRRESFGEPFREMCEAMREIADAYPDLGVIYPVHPNPNVRRTAEQVLGGHPRVLLIAPVDYVTFVHLMKRAYLLLTDSGGIQEEAPSLRKPVLVMREKTERPEGVEAGVARLVGNRRAGIVAAVRRLLDDESEYAKMATGVNPFGDGMASQRILAAIKALHMVP